MVKAASPFSPCTLGVVSVHLCWAAAACHYLPAWTWATGLIWIKSNPAKKGVSYYRQAEIGLPGTKKQIPDLLGFWMVLNTQSTTAEVRWCFCSICRKHTGSDAADIKITVLFQEIWLGIFPGHQVLFKAQADRKEKNPKILQKWTKISWVKSKASKLQACSCESKTVSLKAVQEFIPSRCFCGFLSADAFFLIGYFLHFFFVKSLKGRRDVSITEDVNSSVEFP